MPTSSISVSPARITKGASARARPKSSVPRVHRDHGLPARRARPRRSCRARSRSPRRRASSVWCSPSLVIANVARPRPPAARRRAGAASSRHPRRRRSRSPRPRTRQPARRAPGAAASRRRARRAALDVGQPLVVERLDRDALDAASCGLLASRRRRRRLEELAGSDRRRRCSILLRARHTRSLVAVTDEPTSSATSASERPSISCSVNASRAAGAELVEHRVQPLARRRAPAGARAPGPSLGASARRRRRRASVGLDAAAALRQVAIRDAHADAIDPRREARLRAPAAQRLEHLDERVLQQIVHVAVAAEHAKQARVHAAAVAPEQLARGRRLAGETPVDQQDIFHIGRGHGHQLHRARRPGRGYTPAFERRDFAGVFATRAASGRAGAARPSGPGHSARSLQPSHSPPLQMLLVERLHLIEQRRVVGDDAELEVAAPEPFAPSPAPVQFALPRYSSSPSTITAFRCTRGQRRSASPPASSRGCCASSRAERPRRELRVQQAQLDAARGQLVEQREHRDVASLCFSERRRPGRARRPRPSAPSRSRSRSTR